MKFFWYLVKKNEKFKEFLGRRYIVKEYRKVKDYFLGLDALAEKHWFASDNENIYVAIGAAIGITIICLFTDNNTLYYMDLTVRNYWSFKHYCYPIAYFDPNSYYHPWFTWDPFILDGEVPWDKRWEFDET